MQTVDSVDDSVLANASEVPLTTVIKKMQLDVLDEELQLVRESYRSVLVEHYLLGKTAAEIAANFNLSQPTVEGRLRRGRQQLRMQMLRRGFGFSAAVTVSYPFFAAEQAAAQDLTALVEQLATYSNPHVTDVPCSLSTLIAEETSMASIITTKFSVAILMGSITTAALGWLAVTAVGEQTNPPTVTNLSAETTTAEPAAATLMPGVAQAPAVSVSNSAGADDGSQIQAWPSPVTDRAHLALRSLVPDIAYTAMPLGQVMEGLLTNNADCVVVIKPKFSDDFSDGLPRAVRTSMSVFSRQLHFDDKQRVLFSFNYSKDGETARDWFIKDGAREMQHLLGFQSSVITIGY